MMSKLLALVIPPIILLPLAVADGPAAHLPPRGYVCFQAATPPTVDGKLDDPAWQAAPWSDDFVDIEGDTKPKPRHRTRMKMLWDAKGLYVAAELEEPHLWATLTQHDSVIFQDPDFEMFLDPDGDNHNYAELELNAKNTTWDLFLTKPYKDGGKALHAWEIVGLKTAVALDGTLNNPADTDRGWTLEIFWPWEGLKEFAGVPLPPRDGDRWRVNFSRVEWDVTAEAGKYAKVKGRPEHNWVWSPQGVVDMHRPERWGYLQFSTKPGGPVAYTPDPNQGVKDLLHELYYAETAYHKKHGRYAKTLADLDRPPGVFGQPEIEVTRTGFEASVAADGKRWTITHDARFTGP